MKTYTDVDSYIKSFPVEVQAVLVQLRELIKKTVPAAQESISYGMPAYKYLGKPLVYIGAQKKHIGLYPTPGPILAFKKELVGYTQSKGAVQIPYGVRLPRTLIARMVTHRKAEIASSIKKN